MKCIASVCRLHCLTDSISGSLLLKMQSGTVPPCHRKSLPIIIRSDYGTVTSGRQSTTATLSSIPARMKDTAAGSHSKGLRALNRTLTAFDDSRHGRRDSLPSTLVSGLAKNLTLSQSGLNVGSVNQSEYSNLVRFRCAAHGHSAPALSSSLIWILGECGHLNY